jgi:hypothetical protein
MNHACVLILGEVISFHHEEHEGHEEKILRVRCTYLLVTQMGAELMPSSPILLNMIDQMLKSLCFMLNNIVLNGIKNHRIGIVHPHDCGASL